MQNIYDYLTIASHVIASIIVAITPTPKDNNVLICVKKIFDILSLKIGHAK